MADSILISLLKGTRCTLIQYASHAALWLGRAYVRATHASRMHTRRSRVVNQLSGVWDGEKMYSESATHSPRRRPQDEFMKNQCSHTRGTGHASNDDDESGAVYTLKITPREGTTSKPRKLIGGPSQGTAAGYSHRGNSWRFDLSLCWRTSGISETLGTTQPCMLVFMVKLRAANAKERPNCVCSVALQRVILAPKTYEVPV